MLASAIAGFTLGILGGFHCIGMCGPLIITIPFQVLSSKTKKIVAYILYGSGKTLAYMNLGLLVGLVGGQARQIHAQRYVSIIAGLLLLLTALLPIVFKRINFQPAFMTRFTNWVNKNIALQFKNQKLYSFGIIGFLNGLLPCGLVYVAIAASVSASCTAHSVILMLFFGIATMLSLTVFSLVFQLLPINIRGKLRKLFPYLIIGTALLLILRGMQLGIPYLSPIFDSSASECGHSCCGG